jgi:hypothetical protein
MMQEQVHTVVHIIIIDFSTVVEMNSSKSKQ